MPRAPARFTQAEIARVIRAAKAEGVQAVEVHEGKLRLVLISEKDGKRPDREPNGAGKARKVVL